MDIKQAIAGGKTSLGVEFGSTRIKAVLIGEDFSPLAQGDHHWENRLEGGVWTYHLDDVWAGLRECYGKLAAEVKEKYGVPLETVGSIGVSAMMHGYLIFNKNGKQLAPFRTWRNTFTEKAAAELSSLFNFNIPQRWSVAHLYQAVLNKEPHAGEVAFLTSLAGYVHWKLTGEKAAGFNDASGLFPLDGETGCYNKTMLNKFDDLLSPCGFRWKIEQILPAPIKVGEKAGSLTAEGAKLFDPTGVLKAGIPFCPPEGDAGTGMIATNSIAPRTGNVSAGTSVFAMIVLEKDLAGVYPEIDIVATPAGKPVAMVHCNNCTGDIDSWIRLLNEAIELAGGSIDKTALYTALFNKAFEGEPGCGGLVSYNFLSGEHITALEQGRPLFARMPDSRFTLANFMRSLLFSAVGTLKIGMDILTEKENVRLDSLLGHGGFFKVKGAGQKIIAAAMNTSVSVMESAGEGGAWGIALLAAFALRGNGERLDTFLAEKVFAGNTGHKIDPDPSDVAGFAEYMKLYTAGLAVERAAVENWRTND